MAPSEHDRVLILGAAGGAASLIVQAAAAAGATVVGAVRGERKREAVRRHLRAHLEAAGGEDDEASAEPTAVTRQTNTEPVSSHSERMREIADWYLPLSNELI